MTIQEQGKQQEMLKASEYSRVVAISKESRSPLQHRSLQHRGSASNKSCILEVTPADHWLTAEAGINDRSS